MAQTHPEYFPGPDQPENPEYAVFQILKKLPDCYSVFYSKKFKAGQNRREECEIDFIIFDGHRSLLCLEVKGGILRYDGSQDCWYQNDKKLAKAPDRQAASGMRILMDFLGNDIARVNVGWAICFPDCSMPPDFQQPSGIPKEIILDQSGLLDVETSIARIENYYRQQFHKPGASKTEVRNILSALTRGIGFINSLGVRIARDYQQIIEVTSEQFSVLEDLSLNPRVIVKGFAGTGKTLMAQEFAKRLLGEGCSVLLLFFNRMISNNVRFAFERSSPLTCTTFHSLARSLIESTDPSWWNSQKHSEEDFWNTILPLKLLELEPGQLPKYDAIVVDEGQDFKPEWYEFLAQLLADQRRSRFVVFYDENQDIFGHWDGLPWNPSGYMKKVLTRNCRNTKSIVKYLRGRFPCEMSWFERSPDGLEVVERFVKNPEEERRSLIADVEEVIVQGVDPGRIVIIPNKPRTHSVLSDIEQISGIGLSWMGRSYRSTSNSIRFAGISIFKGLEADVVFLVDFHDMTTEDFSKTLYVEASRARELLFVYIPENLVKEK